VNSPSGVAFAARAVPPSGPPITSSRGSPGARNPLVASEGNPRTKGIAYHSWCETGHSARLRLEAHKPEAFTPAALTNHRDDVAAPGSRIAVAKQCLGSAPVSCAQLKDTSSERSGSFLPMARVQ
jgi:hypothetical protein